MDIVFTNIANTETQRTSVWEQLETYGKKYNVTFGQIAFEQKQDSKKPVIKVLDMERGPLGTPAYYHPLSAVIALAYKNEASLILMTPDGEPFLSAQNIQKNVREAQSAHATDPYLVCAQKSFKHLKYQKL